MVTIVFTTKLNLKLKEKAAFGETTTHGCELRNNEAYRYATLVRCFLYTRQNKLTNKAIQIPLLHSCFSAGTLNFNHRLITL